MGLIQRLYKKLKTEEKIKLYAPNPIQGQFAPVISFNVLTQNSSKVADVLSQNGIAVRGGLHCAPFAHTQMGTLETGSVRVSVASFNNINEMETLVNVLQAKILKI